MATVAQGQSQLVNLGPNDAIKVSTPGEAYVDHLSGTPESPYASTRLIKNTEPKVFGPYGVASQLRLRATEGLASFESFSSPQPAQMVKGDGGQLMLVGPDGEKIRLEAGKITRIPLLTAMDFYNATFSGTASQALVDGYFPGSKGISLGNKSGTYHDVQLNTQRPVHDTGRIEVLLWVDPRYRAYRETPSAAPAVGLTISPDNVTSGPTNYKVFSITPDVLHPGWNRIVISTSGNAAVNRNNWTITGEVPANSPVNYVKVHVSFNAASTNDERVIVLGGVSFLPQATFEDIPTFILGFEQWGYYAAGVNDQLRSWIESMGAQGILTGRTITRSAAIENQIRAAAAAGWDISHQGNGDNEGNDINFYTYSAAYPTAASRLALFQASYASADAYLDSLGITQSPFASYPQNGMFTEGNDWLLNVRGKKIIRAALELQGQNPDGHLSPYVHSFDFGSNGTATTFANTFSNKLRSLLDNGGIYTGYVHQVVPDATTPDSTRLQQRISEIQRTVDFALDLQSRGLMRVCRPSDIL